MSERVSSVRVIRVGLPRRPARTAAFVVVVCLAPCLAGCGATAARRPATPAPVPVQTVGPSLVVTPASGAARPAERAPSGRLAAMVNGEQVPAWELDALLRLNGQSGTLGGASVSSSTWTWVRKRTIAQVVDEALLNSYALAHGLAVTPRTVDARLEVYRLQGGSGFTALLARIGVTEAQFRRMVERNLNAQAVTRHIINGISAPTVRVQVVQVVAATPARARAARNELLRGADAVLVAVHESSDPVVRQLGGQLPPLTRAQGDARFGPHWSAAAFALPPGAVGEPVRLNDGWAVMQMVERQPAFARITRVVDLFIASLRRAARITLYVR